MGKRAARRRGDTYMHVRDNPPNRQPSDSARAIWGRTYILASEQGSEPFFVQPAVGALMGMHTTPATFGVMCVCSWFHLGPAAAADAKPIKKNYKKPTTCVRRKKERKTRNTIPSARISRLAFSFACWYFFVRSWLSAPSSLSRGLFGSLFIDPPSGSSSLPPSTHYHRAFSPAPCSFLLPSFGVSAARSFFVQTATGGPFPLSGCWKTVRRNRSGDKKVN